ncbi:hypothetical protein CL629_04825 [bacterium]|nr:hypothetical protein [bacterium]
MFTLNTSKTIIGLLAVSLIFSGIFVAIKVIQAAHVTDADGITPEVTAGNTENEYTVTLTNNASSTDSIAEIDIAIPDGFTFSGVETITCPLSWGKASPPESNEIQCIKGVQHDHLAPGESASVTFSATSPDALEEDTDYHWDTTTWDEQSYNITTSLESVVDVTAPLTTDNATSTWTNEDVTITLTPIDNFVEHVDGSGIANTFYTSDGNDPTESSSEGTSISLTNTGTYTIKYFSIDNVGNTEDVKTAENQVRIDKIAPTISTTSITLPEGQNAVKEGDTIEISAEVTDTPSGVETVTIDLTPLEGDAEYSLNLTGSSTYSNTFTIATSTNIENGTKTLVITATDIATNSTQDTSVSTLFDNEDPTASPTLDEPNEQTAVKNLDDITIGGTIDGTGSTPTLTASTFRVYDASSTEIGEGTDTTELVTQDGTNISGTINIGTLETNAVTVRLELELLDEAGNTAIILSDSVTVDNTTPQISSITLTPPNSQTNVKDGDTVTITVETDSNTENTGIGDASDFGTEDDTTLSPKDGSETALEGTFVVASGGANTEGQVLVYVERPANASSTIDVSNELTIDNTPPTFSNVTSTPAETKAGEISITFTSDELLIANPIVQVGTNDATFTTSSDLNYTYTYAVTENDAQGTNTITITGNDLANNETENTDGNVLIDTVGPTIDSLDLGTAIYIEDFYTLTATFTEDIDENTVPEISITYSSSTGVCDNIEAEEMDFEDSNTYSYELEVYDDCDAATGTITISTAQDELGNIMSPDSSGTFTVDTVAPEMLEAVTADTDENGQIDQVTITFNEDLADESIDIENFDVDGYDATSTTETAGVLTIIIIEDNEGANTDEELDLYIYNVEDLAGNEIDDDFITADDNAGPVLMEAETTSATTITAIFSEDLDEETIDASDFTVEDNTVTNAEETDDGEVTLTLGTSINADATPDVTITAGVLEDINGNPNVERTVNPADATPPGISGVTPTPNTTGLDPNNPGITVTFDEDVTISEENVDLESEWDEQDVTVSYDSETRTATITPGDTLDGDSTYTVYLYNIVDDSENEIDEYDWDFTTAVTYSIDLTQGWNLISIPIVPQSSDVGDVLGELNSSSTISSVYTYDKGTNTWSVYRPGSPETSNLDELTAGYAYWINYSSEDEGTIEGYGNTFQGGEITPPERTLYEGWNMLGYYQIEGTTSEPANFALATLLTDTWDETSAYWSSIRSYDNESKTFDTVDFEDDIDPGAGYWIFLKSFSPSIDYAYGPGNGSDDE